MTGMYCREFLIAYHEQDKEHCKLTWWNFMLNKKFIHVDVYIEIAGGYLLIQPNVMGMGLYEQYFTKKEILTLDKTIFQSYIVKEDQIKIRPKGLITCVSIVKSLLYVKKWWIITPFQLYKYIERQQNVNI